MVVLSLIVSLAITGVSYFAFPYLYVKKYGKAAKWKARWIALANFIVCHIIWIIVSQSIMTDGAAAITYAPILWLFFTEAYLRDKGGSSQKKYNMRFKENFSRMFRQSFGNVIDDENIKINGQNAIIYTFNPATCRSMGDFAYMVELSGAKPRYFASEYSYGKTFVLCEWEFDGEKETRHINYGPIVNSITEKNKHQRVLLNKIEEILRKQ